jgi:hypothetical protein
MNVFKTFLETFSDYSSFKIELAKKNLIINEDTVENLAIIKLTSDSDLEDPIVNQSKGVIINMVTLKIVAPFVQIPINISETLLNTNGISLVTAAHDGVLIRVYHHDDLWKFSTNRMIFPSRGWNGSRTFADMFSELDSNIDYSTLNQSLCYYYIMEHPDNFNIVKHTTPSLTLIRTINIDTLEIVEIAAEIANFKNIDEIRKGLETAKIGYMVKDKCGNLFRFETSEFMRATKLKNNQSDPRFRWTELRKDDELVAEYLKFFPSCASDFEAMEKRYVSLAKLLHRQYINRFGSHIYTKHHSRHVSTITGLHDLYLSRCERVITSPNITLDDVYNILNDMPNKQLFYLMNPNNVPSTSAC